MRPWKIVKLVWQIVTLIRPDEWRRQARWCAWLILLAATINAPFAVTRLVHTRSPSTNPGGTRTGDDMPGHWPSTTPHDKPWPAPDQWSEWRALATRHVDARWSNPVNGKRGFSMTVFLYGWPLPVLEQKQMWWDRNDPALTGPDSNPPMGLRVAGLILNPIIVGGVAYVLLTLPLFAFVVGARHERTAVARQPQS